VHDVGPWCKAEAVADALRQADEDMLVIADADVWTDPRSVSMATRAAEGGLQRVDPLPEPFPIAAADRSCISLTTCRSSRLGRPRQFVVPAGRADRNVLVALMSTPTL